MSSLANEVLDLARQFGADAVAITDAAPFPEARSTLRGHKSSGKSGPLSFTFDHPIEATDVRESFPWAESLVVMGHDYLEPPTAAAKTGAMIARFATRDHYEPLREIAGKVAAWLGDHGYRAQVLVDDNRLADRLPAIRSGLGWQGRSTMVLSPGHGPWLLIGTVVTDAPLIPTEASARSCGTCTACLPACPTGALGADGLDARRCLSTWLQTGGSIPLWIRPLLGRRIYGCDECLLACPPGFPRLRAAAGDATEFAFSELLTTGDEELLERFGHWYIPGREARHLRRNLLVAAGNSGEPGAWGSVRSHLPHRSAVVRGHAAWALARSGAPDAVETLEDRIIEESIPDVVDEIEVALLMRRDPDGYRRLLEEDERRNAGRSAPGRIAETVSQGHHRLGVDLADT